jgi:hypothetical protein
MIRFNQYWILWAAVMVAVALVCGPGCSARTASPRVAATELESNRTLMVECEREFLYLGSLIETKRRDRDFPAVVLAEVIALRRAAGELFFDGEYELALELIDEAVSLLEGPP